MVVTAYTAAKSPTALLATSAKAIKFRYKNKNEAEQKIIAGKATSAEKSCNESGAGKGKSSIEKETDTMQVYANKLLTSSKYEYKITNLLLLSLML